MTDQTPPDYPQPIDFGDIRVGMHVTVTTTQTSGAYAAITGTVTAATTDQVTLDGDVTISAAQPAGTTVTITLLDPPTGPPDEPGQSVIVLDDTGTAWQHLAGGWYSVRGGGLSWADLWAQHPNHTLLHDIPATPLPDPVDPYPKPIDPADARIGMDLRVTITRPDGAKTVRAICVWNQSDPPPDDPLPDFLILGIPSGSVDVDPDVLQAAGPDVQAMIQGRTVIQYAPLQDGVTLTVEQMADWTADTIWQNAVPEPPDGTVIRGRDGTAWQRIGTATEDGPTDQGGPWYLTGQGMWAPVSVTGALARSWLWLWGAAAPFTLQEAG